MTTVCQIHFVLRPNASGVWSVQDDADHESFGVDKVTGVIQGSDFIRVYFNPVYEKAGVVQITTDDDFAGSISAHASLGTQAVHIRLKAAPHLLATDPWINPAQIWNHVPNNGGGNLWVSVSMVNPL